MKCVLCAKLVNMFSITITIRCVFPWRAVLLDSNRFQVQQPAKQARDKALGSVKNMKANYKASPHYLIKTLCNDTSLAWRLSRRGRGGG